MKSCSFAFILAIAVSYLPARAADEPTIWPSHAFDLDSSDNQPRSAFFLPLGSYILPGLGQWSEGQYGYGAFYSGTALAGTAIIGSHAKNISLDNPNAEDANTRRAFYGTQMYSVAGGLSAYHSFRNAVRSRREAGEYAFLKPEHEESPGELALAPFHFSYLARPTTIAPLAAVIILIVFLEDHNHPFNLSPHEAALTGGVSYTAGLGEEATFRGWMLPWARENTGSDVGANLGTSAIFGALHYSRSNPFPIAQFAVGYYLGWLTQRNNWTLGQSIFVHAWWDVLALGSQLAFQKKAAYIPLPPIAFSF